MCKGFHFVSVNRILLVGPQWSGGSLKFVVERSLVGDPIPANIRGLGGPSARQMVETISHLTCNTIASQVSSLCCDVKVWKMRCWFTRCHFHCSKLAQSSFFVAS
ncbi:hypothetical protein AVEN_212205-1 [Araneus ventricosus]|uniref:Uncharacterized protein n=1 Tax=Araneus ventricosus TaxID=182803 RepID=A0A4Y2HT93_ARAVE|nr:hypothetical protein AVEN_212205-1 [Araneus ventricosus]